MPSVAPLQVFVNVVSAIFADLQDSRIRNLFFGRIVAWLTSRSEAKMWMQLCNLRFILLLHLMTTKELESAPGLGISLSAW